MSDFAYNSIGLQMTTITRHLEVVYDGPTFLFERWLLRVVGRFNPDAPPTYGGAAAALPGAINLPFVGPVELSVPGLPSNPIAPLSDVTVRHILSQPQKSLVITFDDDTLPGGKYVWLRSPAPGFKTDANLGPKPLHVNVTKITGSTDFEIEWIGEICINECPSPNIVLSHRWTATDDISDAKGGFLTSRTYSGEVILNTSRMLQSVVPGTNQRVIPDNYRRVLFMPVMANCQRGPVHVEADADGNRLRYRFTDSERMWNLTSTIQRTCPGLMDVEANHAAGIGKPNLDQLIIAMGGVVVRGLERFNRATTGGIVGVNPLGFGAAAVASLFDAGLSIIQFVPKDEHTVTCTAYGDRTANYKNLEAVAMAFVRTRLGAAGNIIPGGTGYANIVYDFRKDMKTVDVSMRVKRGIATAALGNIFGLGTIRNLRGAAQGAGPDIGALENMVEGGFVSFATANLMPAVRQNGNIISTSRTTVVPVQLVPNGPVFEVPTGALNTNPGPQTDGGTRGTLFEGLVTQILQSSCGLPPGPTLYGTAASLNMS